MRCPACRHENPDDYAYCGRCGLSPSAAGSGAASPSPVSNAQESTRYLCAAVHFDSNLARLVVENLLEEPSRAVAQSPATDLVAVCRHALAARRRHAVRDGALAVALIVCLAYGLIKGADQGFGLGALFTAVGAVFGFVFYLVLFSWLVIVAEGGLARWGPTARALRRGQFDPEHAPRPRDEFVKGQLAHVEENVGGNITVYQDYNPFLGHGWSIRGWSFSIDVTTPNDPADPVESLDVVDLYKRLAKRIAALDLAQIAVHNRLFVNGGDIHHDRRFLPDPTGCPVASVDEALMTELMRSPENRARPYLATEIVSWDGEVVWSAFVRVAVSDSSLFAEANYCVLPPLHARYHEIDDLLLRPSARAVGRLMWRSLFALPRTVLHCLPGVVNHLLARPRFERKVRLQRRDMEEVFTFDHGALLSVREAASDLRRTKDGLALGYHRHFQLLDEEMFTKTVEKRVIETLAEFLIEHNIDTAELRSRSEQIVNTNVTIGGDATLVNSAIGGQSAKVSTGAARAGLGRAKSADS